MKKDLLLSLCLICVSGVCACSSTSNNTDKTTSYDYTIEEVVDDALQTPDDAYSVEQCGANGVACNNTPLINYTKTEADYRAYGERTKRDYLYTQAATGNNLVATVRPSIEEDVVTETTISARKKDPKTTLDDGVFEQTTAQKIEEPETSSKPEIKLADNIAKIEEPKEPKKDFTYEVVCANPDCSEVKKVKKSVSEDGSVYEIVCDEECDDDVMDDDTFSSEFTEESFDIADYVKDDDKDIEFKEIGKTITADIDINEIRVDDNAILTWDAVEGDNLRELITKWSTMSGWKLLWNTNRNYVLSAGVMFKGKFVDVSSALIRVFARARPAPIATFYKGNRVIVVETMENENAY